MKLTWDNLGERYFETGVSNAVLYQFVDNEFKNGVAWNGLISVGLNPSGSDAFEGKLYRNDHLVGVAQGFSEYIGKISAYTYPDEFEACIGYDEVLPGVFGSQQVHALFGLSYKTIIGNDLKGESLGYKIHLVYNCLVEANEKSYSTITDNPDIIELVYDFETFPVDSDLTDNPSSEIILDSRKLAPDQLTLLESILYGTDEEDPRMPYPDELVELLSEAMPDNRTYPNSNTYPNDELFPIG